MPQVDDITRQRCLVADVTCRSIGIASTCSSSSHWCDIGNMISLLAAYKISGHYCSVIQLTMCTGDTLSQRNVNCFATALHFAPVVRMLCARCEENCGEG